MLKIHEKPISSFISQPISTNLVSNERTSQYLKSLEPEFWISIHLATATAVAAPTQNLGDCRAELLYASQPFRRFSRVHCALLPMLIWPFYTLNPQLYPSSITCFLPIVKIPSRKKVVLRQKWPFSSPETFHHHLIHLIHQIIQPFFLP